MSDWQKGDLAVCVDDTPHPHLGDAIVRRGQTYRVVRVVTAPSDHSLFGGRLGLLMDGVDSKTPWGFSAARFRKIRPDAHEGCADNWQFIVETTKRKSPSPAEREKRILEALFPQRDGSVPNKPLPVNK